MDSYFLFALVAGGCVLLTGTGLFVLLRKRVPHRRSRLGIALSASLLSFAVCLLLPPLLAVLRGSTRLPGWSFFVFAVLFAALLLSFWKSVLNRFYMEHEEDSMEPGAVEEPRGAEERTESRLDSQSGKELESLPPDTPLGFVVELSALPKADSVSGKIPDSSDAPKPEADTVTASMPQPEPSAAPEGMPLVPEPVPAWVPFIRLVEKAWEERSAGRPVQAASWFLACLTRPPSAVVRDEILLDVCALLKEYGYAREALAFLSDPLVSDCDVSLLSRLRSELELAVPPVA